MSRKYKFYNPEAAYFVSFAVVEWLDVFTRNEYKNIFLDSLSYCQKEKGMEVYAWCIMTNHVQGTLHLKPQQNCSNVGTISKNEGYRMYTKTVEK